MANILETEEGLDRKWRIAKKDGKILLQFKSDNTYVTVAHVTEDGYLVTNSIHHDNKEPELKLDSNGYILTR